jgi:CelD/BcsL family acetyltransferase involved in cellulose biosynthesis
MTAATGAGALVAGLESDGAVSVVMPCYSRPDAILYRVLGRTLGRRQLLTQHVCGGDLLVRERCDAGGLGALWQAVFAGHAGTEAIRFSRLAAVHLPLLRESVRHVKGAALYVAGALPHYFLRLPVDRQAYLAIRSHDSWRRLERYERRLAREAGSLRLLELTKETDWLPCKDAIHDLMDRAWQAAALGHRLDLDAQSHAARHGLLRSFAIFAGEQVIAFQLAYQGKGVLLLQQTGYDQAWAKYGPGTILQHRMMLRLLDHDPPKFLDFGVGEAPYKQHMSNTYVPVLSVLILRNGRAWKGPVLLANGLRHLDGMLRRIIKRFGWRPHRRTSRGGNI